MPRRSAPPTPSPGTELRVRPLSPEEYALWAGGRAPALALPARLGTTEVAVLVYARTGPVANVLVRAEPGAHLTAEIRVLDLLAPEPASEPAAAVVAALVANFRRGGYSQFRAWTAADATGPFAAAGFAAVGRDVTRALAGAADRRGVAGGRTRLGRRPAAWTVADAQEKDVASFIAWLTSARTSTVLTRTPDRAGLRARVADPEEHFLTLRQGDSTVGDAWASLVEAPAAGGDLRTGAVVRALRLRGGLDAASLSGADAALGAWAAAQGAASIDAHVPAAADPALVQLCLEIGYRDAGVQLELVVEDEQS